MPIQSPITDWAAAEVVMISVYHRQASIKMLRSDEILLQRSGHSALTPIDACGNTPADLAPRNNARPREASAV